jgi:hypothetical protein
MSNYSEPTDIPIVVRKRKVRLPIAEVSELQVTNTLF